MGLTLKHEKPPGMAALEAPEEIAHPVSILEIDISKNAKQTIGLAVKEVAAQCGVTEKAVARNMFGSMYWLEPSDRLMIVLSVDEAEADMFIEIPKEHWEFKGGGRVTQ